MNRIYKLIIKNFIIIAVVFCFFPNVSNANELSFKECEYTTNYKNWLKLSEEERLKTREPQKCKIDGSFYTTEQQRNTKSTPSASIYDSRYLAADYNLITSIKDQGSYATCWAFSSTANIETSLIKEGKYGLNKNNINLSEAHLSIATSNKVNVLPFRRTYDEGGYPQIEAASYYMNRLGPINDSLMPYSIMDKIKNNSITITGADILNKNAEYSVNDSFVHNSGEKAACKSNEINDIKQYILDKGSLTATIYTDLAVWNSSENRYYFYSNKGYLQNAHSVLIIGWDDNISAASFKNSIGETSTRKGGWIIKNSWGTQNYDYVSYDDVDVCGEITGFYNIDKGKEDNSYVLDKLGASESVMLRESIYVANIFTKQTENNEKLSKVSFLSYLNGQQYDIVYSSTGEWSDLRKIYSGTVNKTGYTTVKFDDIVITNDTFILGVNYKASNNKNIIPMYRYNAYSTIYNMKVPNPTSYISDTEEPDSFSPFYNGIDTYYIASIRGYTNNMGTIDIRDANIEGILDKTYNGKAQTQKLVLTYTGNKLKEGTNYTVTYKNNINKGTATVIITGKGNYTGTIEKTFTIKPKNITTGLTIKGNASKKYNGKLQTQTTLTIYYNNIKLTKDVDYTIGAYSNNKMIGTAKYKITGKGNYTGTINKTFYIIPGKVSIYKPVVGSKKITVKYKTINGGVKYQIGYKLKTSKKWKFVTTSKTSYTKKKLKSKKYYNVKVRAYKIVNGKTYNGAWSKIKTVKVK